MTPEKEFWKWFSKNQDKYFFLNQITENSVKDKLLDDFLIQLHKYCSNLYFLIGGEPDEKQELIITAEGNKDYFSNIVELTRNAPNFDKWEIIPFKPPQGVDFVTKYKGITINPMQMWFFPLENEENPNLLGLKIYHDNYDLKKEKDYLFATYIILDTILGEKSNTEDIDYIELEKLPKDYKKLGLIKLSELPDYINWHKEKVNSY